MALPYLIKRIYTSSSEEVVRRGKKIHNTPNAIELVEYDELMGNISFRVKDDNYNSYYKVNLNQFRNEKTLSLRCTCPYNITEVCRHKAASLFYLQELLDKNMLGNSEIEYHQKHTVVKMKQIDLKLLKMFSNISGFIAAEEFLRSNKPNIVDAKDETVWATITESGIEYKLLIRKNDERNFDTSCTCDTERRHPLCLHKTIVFLHLLNKHGINYFDSIRNWDTVKDKLLSIYGYSLKDNLKNKFEFTYQDGRPFLRVLDNTIKRVVAPLEVAAKPRLFEMEAVPTAPVVLNNFTEEDKPKLPELKLGLVFTTPSTQYPFLQIDCIQGVANETHTAFVTRIEKIDLNKYVNTDFFDEDDKQTLQQVRKFLPYEISRYINRNSPFGGIWENIIQQQDEELPIETRQLIAEYIHPKLKRIFEEQSNSAFMFQLPEGKQFTSSSIQNIHLAKESITPYFSILKNESDYTVECRIKLPNSDLNISESEHVSPFIFQMHETMYLWENAEDIHVVEKYLPVGCINITAENWNNQLEEYILPLTKKYEVDFGNVQKEEVKNVEPSLQIVLKEKGEYLVFEPVFTYNNYRVTGSENEKIVFPFEDKIFIIERNINAENELVKKIEALHSQFVKPNNDNTLALRGAEVLKNNWFFLFIDAAKELNIPVYGFDTLRNYRFNTSRPSTKIFISSNTDWFDAKVEIDFAGQKVSVADVKNALANKQQFVPLADGTLGILPEDWIRKYSLLFKVGEGKQDNMKLSKFQYSVIEDLYEQRNEEELFFQLEEKYDKLRYNYEIKKVPTPEHLAPILRPYQESGFQWLNYLTEVQWGGILADDMGLGKTIQALTFLHHLKTTNGKLKALVVCPTTLMFNWQNEIKKFTPDITYHTHHGGARMLEDVKKKEADVIITTYGTLRSDIQEFMQLQFDYVVLDESQAIKNPSSKVTKAACLLKATSRLCLSGTPLQNNTFDIFAQMNFLNPGMLGSQEFFKSEFAVPIDRFGEKDQKAHLRKLLYPFILRRTKEQVAKDLPEKQEMVLFCEMGDEQRKIYDAYRNDFRDKIMGVVQEQGIQKSQLSILQGLMKLRQICDSPAIVKETDGEKYPNVSVKLDEIGREISENISNHKALVFSQFLGMLALIKERLKQLGIAYEYFDGSSSAAERERAINNFQNNEECRVFLISLKAGGVGLNLTAADYVYIVDPWWNPAVEQQAIDRTHRIGQTKNIFAYRMICTDTVEDKILKLQDKKKKLATDLITDDEGFVKSLTKEDVDYLFS
ncbi:MAG: DEAD/DEAH box helicase [Bacteroidetes bacterium]|nr:DEAD/DEAH box helicase [Bacteroidota bacterium]